MALIGRLFVIFFAFLCACLAAGMIVVGAVLYPEFSDLSTGPIDQSAINVVLGFIFISGFALLPALIVVLITEAFYVRGVLTYAVGGAIVGAACYLGLIPFDPATMHFDGIVRRHLEIMTGAGIVAGLIYWMIAGRSAGAWREPRRPLRPPPPLPSQTPLPSVPPQSPPSS
jgi:phosphotransferase system  glucose/maltose/N-acetylglucosamine-specific IIC component